MAYWSNLPDGLILRSYPTDLPKKITRWICPTGILDRLERRAYSRDLPDGLTRRDVLTDLSDQLPDGLARREYSTDLLHSSDKLT
ncbi:unnamed protein product [Acanthoscelides obtectus]|uniref:Uncharacterized protein n=1 Tax=Acanthoscelides obtectus TaxID=200917 RepID=A0A9P0KAX8_ACAOB|nr:unnamed protein product [Acanthoscelides obtectus]CAK1629347.1 hypothetical protein AOBTE_LOCUS5693 [Acanthoscelides obtectus]